MDQAGQRGTEMDGDSGRQDVWRWPRSDPYSALLSTGSARRTRLPPWEQRETPLTRTDIRAQNVTTAKRAAFGGLYRLLCDSSASAFASNPRSTTRRAYAPESMPAALQSEAAARCADCGPIPSQTQLPLFEGDKDAYKVATMEESSF